MRGVKIFLIVAAFMFGTALGDAQAKAGGVHGRGNGKMLSGGSGGAYFGSPYYGKGNQQNRGNGLRLHLRDGSCISSQGTGRNQGVQPRGTDRNRAPRNKAR